MTATIGNAMTDNILVYCNMVRRPLFDVSTNSSIIIRPSDDVLFNSVYYDMDDGCRSQSTSVVDFIWLWGLWCHDAQCIWLWRLWCHDAQCPSDDVLLGGRWNDAIDAMLSWLMSRSLYPDEYHRLSSRFSQLQISNGLTVNIIRREGNDQH